MISCRPHSKPPRSAADRATGRSGRHSATGSIANAKAVGTLPVRRIRCSRCRARMLSTTSPPNSRGPTAPRRRPPRRRRARPRQPPGQDIDELAIAVVMAGQPSCGSAPAPAVGPSCGTGRRCAARRASWRAPADNARDRRQSGQRRSGEHVRRQSRRHTRRRCDRRKRAACSGTPRRLGRRDAVAVMVEAHQAALRHRRLRLRGSRRSGPGYEIRLAVRPRRLPKRSWSVCSDARSPAPGRGNAPPSPGVELGIAGKVQPRRKQALADIADLVLRPALSPSPLPACTPPDQPGNASTSAKSGG